MLHKSIITTKWNVKRSDIKTKGRSNEVKLQLLGEDHDPHFGNQWASSCSRLQRFPVHPDVIETITWLCLEALSGKSYGKTRRLILITLCVFIVGLGGPCSYTEVGRLLRAAHINAAAHDGELLDVYGLDLPTRRLHAGYCAPLAASVYFEPVILFTRHEALFSLGATVLVRIFINSFSLLYY